MTTEPYWKEKPNSAGKCPNSAGNIPEAGWNPLRAWLEGVTRTRLASIPELTGKEPELGWKKP
jgi:hypothetical protein